MKRMRTPGFPEGINGFTISSALLLSALLIGSVSVQAADGGAKSASPAKAALDLYSSGKFVESADAFEAAIKASPPSGRLYYYAALANLKANRKARAYQLCDYVMSNYFGSEEYGHCRRIMEGARAKTAGTAPVASSSYSFQPSQPALLDENNLPPDFFASMPKDVVAHLKTPAGKVSLKKAVADYNKKLLASASSGAIVDSASRAKTNSTSSGAKAGGFPFTAADIARDGANGIDQGRNPNCWFEASMAALAELPRGQRLLASMIRSTGPGSYVVRFPGDGNEYRITDAELDARGIHDRAVWASLIECAQVMKFPDNRGAEGASGDESRLAVGLSCITGCKAQVMRPGTAEPQELSSFIGSAVSSKNPIVCGTWHDSYLAQYEDLVVGQHAYTIIGYDPASNMITIRNPHGKHSQRFHMADDPGHRKFEMKEDGVFRMHLSLFQKYFHSVCSSFI